MRRDGSGRCLGPEGAGRGADLPGPEVLAREILKGLSEGRFVPGQRLAERDLMDRYGLGRSTVREALGRLAVAGVVELIPHRGAQIRRLTRREAGDVLRVAMVLMELGSRQAAEAVRAGADPAALMAAVTAYSAAPPGEELARRGRYYRALGVLSGNQELMRLLPTIQVPLVRAQMRGNLGQRLAGHVELAAAIATGDPDQAAMAARLHLERMLALVAELPEESFARDPG